MKQDELTRRTFFKVSGKLGAGLLLGFYLPPKQRSQSITIEDAVGKTALSEHGLRLWNPNAFIRIAPDNSTTIVVHKSEMGQGVYTALPMMIVEELEADWSRIRIEAAPAHQDYYHTVWKIYQGTGASTSISSTWEQLRLAGATAREMLISAAAKTWNVSPRQCMAQKSHVIDRISHQRLSFGALAELAAEMEVPSDVVLKQPHEFKLIGKPIKRLDTAEKVNGSAVYGLDIRVPEMLVAAIARPPVFGGSVKWIEDKEAWQVEGVKYIVNLDIGVAVVADRFWAAKTARDALKIEWYEGNNRQSSEQLQRKYADLAKTPGLIVKNLGDIAIAFQSAEQTLSAVYETPYLAHAPMEPLNCVADVRTDGCQIWTGTQMQTTDRQAACEITGLKPEQIQIHTTLLGSSFGRRANPHADYVKEAVLLSKRIGKPVKVIWTREDDIRGGYYRPVHYSKITAGLDREGKIIAWKHRLVGESIGKGTQFERVLVHHGIDHLSVEGAADHPYSIPHQLIDHHAAENGIPVLWWRSVGHSFTAFVIESFLDELANLTEQDPVKLRLDLLKDCPRHQKVLKLAAKNADWGARLPQGVYRGIALHKSFGSIVAQIAEVSVSEDKTVKVHRVVCVVDCGIVINPDTVRAQIESGIVYGLSAALYGEISLQNGRVQQSNFHDYPVLRMNEMPQVEVEIITSQEKPSGVGEISTPPITPAVCNGIFAATGIRIRRLPIQTEILRTI